MAQLSTDPTAGRHRAGVKKARKQQPRTDMTPMVDLAFLLITFFIFTSELTRPRAMNLFMPKDGPGTTFPETGAITFLLGKNNTVYWYYGRMTEAIITNQVHITDYSPDKGIRNVIQQKKKELLTAGDSTRTVMVLIKPLAAARYENVLKALDEMTINRISTYALVNPEKAELLWMEK